MGDFEPSGNSASSGFSLLERQITRRRLLALSAMAGAAAVTASCLPPVEPVDQKKVIPKTHLAWVWQFSTDGTPQQLASVLAQYNLGIILKTHNGTSWMGDWDKSPQAVTGPAQVQNLANYFEKNGVPFHTYCVLNGVDPMTEAQMCAQVIGAGARSVVIDLEPWAGYWAGTPQSAAAFAQEFRRQQPNGVVGLCVEPRPWVMPNIPVAQFASIAQVIEPMVYWETFNTSENASDFKAAGFDPGQRGICPEFLLDVSSSMFSSYGLPIQPVGQGDSTLDAWVRFLTHAYALGMGCVSAWRYGVTNTAVWPLLKANPPGSQIVAPTPTAKPTVAPKFKIGAHAKVVNTGSSCLNVRDAPSEYANVVGCLSDGTTVTIKDGPVDAGGYRWWLVQTSAVKGWAAEANSFGLPWLK